MKLVLIFAILLCGCAATRKNSRDPKTADAAIDRAARFVVAQVKAVPGDLTPRTKYQKSVLKSSAFPGGGWIYECNDAKGPCEHDVSPGVPYFLATAALVAVGINGIKQHNGAQTAAAAGGFLVVRFADVLGAMRAAKRVDK